MKIINTLLLFAFMILGVTVASAQNKVDKHSSAMAFVKKVGFNKRLNKILTNSADRYVYTFNNGTVAPQAQYQCSIEVNETTVKLTTQMGEEPEEILEEHINETQYDTFVNQLVALKIVKQQPNEKLMRLCGGGYKGFTVYKDKKELLNITISFGELNIEYQTLYNLFLGMLTDQQRQQLDDCKNLKPHTKEMPLPEEKP